MLGQDWPLGLVCCGMAEEYDVSFLEARGAEMSVWNALAGTFGQGYCADGKQDDVPAMVEAAPDCTSSDPSYVVPPVQDACFEGMY